MSVEANDLVLQFQGSIAGGGRTSGMNHCRAVGCGFFLEVCHSVLEAAKLLSDTILQSGSLNANVWLAVYGGTMNNVG